MSLRDMLNEEKIIMRKHEKLTNHELNGFLRIFQNLL